MAIRRITISVPETLAEQIKKAAGDRPVSQYVTELIEADLNQEDLQRQWEEFYRDVNPTSADRAWAESLMSDLAKPSHEDPAPGSVDSGVVAPNAGVGAA